MYHNLFSSALLSHFSWNKLIKGDLQVWRESIWWWKQKAWPNCSTCRRKEFRSLRVLHLMYRPRKIISLRKETWEHVSLCKIYFKTGLNKLLSLFLDHSARQQGISTLTFTTILEVSLKFIKLWIKLFIHRTINIKSTLHIYYHLVL